MRNRLVRVELERGRVEEYFDIHRFLGAVEERILVSTVNQEHELQLRFVDPDSLAAGSGPGWRISVDWALVPAAEGTFYSARLDSRGIYTPFRFDPAGGEQKWLAAQGVPVSLTSDGLHLLVHNPDSGEIFVWSTAEQRVRTRLRSSDPTGQIRFLTNGLFLLPPPFSGQDSWRLVDVEGNELAKLSFRIPTVDPLFFWFMPDLNRAVVCARGAVNPETAVIDTRELRRWLVRKGHLFEPGGGILNDDRVRVRAHPTLDAQILGHLDRRQRVEVLERSGRRESIGEMKDYWYRVRREDGLTGWSYGHFIDLQ
jgi:hypothetical protein